MPLRARSAHTDSSDAHGQGWKFDAGRNVQRGYEKCTLASATLGYTGYRGKLGRIQQLGHHQADPGGRWCFHLTRRLRIRERSRGDELPLFDALGLGRGNVCVCCHGIFLIHVAAVAVVECVCVVSSRVCVCGEQLGVCVETVLRRSIRWQGWCWPGVTYGLGGAAT